MMREIYQHERLAADETARRLHCGQDDRFLFTAGGMLCLQLGQWLLRRAGSRVMVNWGTECEMSTGGQRASSVNA